MTSFIDLILTSSSIILASLVITVLDGLIPRDVRPGYVVSDIGFLSSQELQNSPEIFLVHLIKDFQITATQSNVASWINKYALQQVESNSRLCRDYSKLIIPEWWQGLGNMSIE